MPPSKALVSFADVQEIMSRALQTPRGVRIKCPSMGQAMQLRQRAYSFRQRDRDDSKKMYAQDDPRYAASEYDILKVTVIEEAEQWYTVFEKFDPEKLKEIIEEL